MKGMFETLVERPTTLKLVTYTCDVCGFNTSNSQVATFHYGKEHAIAERITINECGKTFEFLRFVTESDMLEYWRWHQKYSGVDVNWQGYGWYIIQDYDDDAYLMSLTELVEDYKGKVTEAQKIIARLEKL